MVALAILFLQLTLGISNPTSDQINSVTPAQQQSVAPAAGSGGSSVTSPYTDTQVLS